MASPRRKDPGKQQSSTATGVSPPHLDIPTGDTATTLNPSVTATPKPNLQGKTDLPPDLFAVPRLPSIQDQGKDLSHPLLQGEPRNTQCDKLGRATKGVDPWVEIVKKFKSPSPKPAPEQTQQAPAAQIFGSYATAATTGGYSSYYPQPGLRSPQPTGPPPKKRKRKAGNTNEGSGRANTAVMQGAGNQPASATQTPQHTTNRASNTDQR
ncbi:hypothetical protein MBLNU13_g08202t1 [Cladosporium sp. NU13]